MLVARRCSFFDLPALADLVRVQASASSQGTDAPRRDPALFRVLDDIHDTIIPLLVRQDTLPCDSSMRGIPRGAGRRGPRRGEVSVFKLNETGFSPISITTPI